MSPIRNQALKFLVVGGTNTLVTYAIFIGLGLIIPPGVAYTIAFMLGLAWVVFGSSRYVFSAGLEWRQLTIFAAWYLLIYAIGQVVVQLIAPTEIVSLAVTSLVVLVVTTPLTFLGGRFIFKAKPSSGSSSADESIE